MKENPLHLAITILLFCGVIYLLAATLIFKPNEKELHSEIKTLIQEAIEGREREAAKNAFLKIETEYTLADIQSLKTLEYGESAARISLQMFGDIECPMCRKMHPVVKQIVDSSEGVINWEYRHFPLMRHNPAAAVESQAIECIKESYGNRTAWAMLELLITQTRGNGKGVDSLPRIAKSYGLSGSLIENCLASDAHKEKINADYELGQSLGVNATPAVKITDKQTNKSILVKGYKSQEQILTIISELLM